MRNRTGDDIPDALAHHEVAKAFFGVLKEVFVKAVGEDADLRDVSSSASLAIDEIVKKNRIVNWTQNPDVQNRMMHAIEDYLFDLKDQQGLDLTFENIDRILDMVIEIARVRYG